MNWLSMVEGGGQTVALEFYHRSELSIVPLIFELKQNENWGGIMMGFTQTC